MSVPDQYRSSVRPPTRHTAPPTRPRAVPKTMHQSIPYRGSVPGAWVPRRCKIRHTRRYLRPRIDPAGSWPSRGPHHRPKFSDQFRDGFLHGTVRLIRHLLLLVQTVPELLRHRPIPDVVGAPDLGGKIAADGRESKTILRLIFVDRAVAFLNLPVHEERVIAAQIGPSQHTKTRVVLHK